jgi:predicted Zn-dependent protease
MLHSFDLALNDLNSILKTNPKHIEALALRSVIYLVQAKYSESKRDCESLVGLTSELISTACLATLEGLTGNNEAAYQKLRRSYSANDKTAGKEQKLWVLNRLAEMAQRAGKNGEAENYYKEALGLDINDTFLLASYADFLLDLHRPAEVIKMLADKTRADVLLLRLALAEDEADTPLADEHQNALRARFDASTQRGQRVHLNEEARFVLYLEKQPDLALKLALENWQAQREPKDARIILEAALAAHKPSEAKPALEWVTQTKHEDKTILRLVQQLKENRK